MRRHPDEQVAPPAARRHRPRQRRRHAALRQVDPVGADRQRHVEPVVDEERTAARPTDREQPLGQPDERRRLELLLAQLHQRRPVGDAGQRRRHHVAEVATAGRAAVGDDVEPRPDRRCPPTR
jgi:hypothetical protein